MTTTICDLNVDWNQCANCARLKRRVDDTHAALLAASERVDQAYDEYRDVRDAGHVAFGTPSHRAWQARLDNLEQQVDEASAASHAAIDEWAKSIRLHHRFHMAYTRIAQSGHVDTGETTTLPETEEMSEVPEPDTTATPIRGRVYRITAYNADQGGCHDVDPATLPDDFLDYLADAAHAAHAAQHGMPVDASQYIPVAVVKSILTKWETDYKGFRDFCASHGLDPNGACCAVFVIKEIRDDIDKLTTTTEENHNA